jgi:hypothetical protein
MSHTAALPTKSRQGMFHVAVGIARGVLEYQQGRATFCGAGAFHFAPIDHVDADLPLPFA